MKEMLKKEFWSYSENHIYFIQGALGFLQSLKN